MKLITAHNIQKNYTAGEITVPALKGLTFTIDPSSFISFIGPSGSGKTTLLNILGCLDVPTGGSVIIDGTDISKLTRRERAAFRGEHIGFIFQDFNLIPVLTVFENIEYPLLMVQNIPSAKRMDRVRRLIAEVGMEDQKGKYPDQISGGQKQRVAIARALATNPKIVLADEPTANLDHDTAYRVIAVMRKMRDEFGTSFIFSTHDQKIVGEAEIIYSLEDGLIIGRKRMKKRVKTKRGKTHAKHN
jgi:putative ABC transport system ATP-binding protein